MNRSTQTSRFVLLCCAALFALGNSDCEPPSAPLVQASPSNVPVGSGSASTPAPDSNPFSSPQQQGPATQPQPGMEPQQTASGTLKRGEHCAETVECSGGLACVAGFCVDDGQLRFSMVWESTADLDLHVVDPSSEEIYYRNRESASGGQFVKDGCLSARCENETGPFIETVIWRGAPPEGKFRFWALNYDGKTAGSVRFEVSVGGQIHEFSASVPASRGGQSEVLEIEVGGSSGNLRFVRPEQEAWVRGPAATLATQSPDQTLARVRYSEGGAELGESSAKPNFEHNHDFSQLGEHRVDAVGADGEGFEVGRDSRLFVVTDAQDLLPVPSGQAVVSARLLSKKLLTLGSVDPYNIQVSGRNDGADARSNLEATAGSNAARRSSYGNAPGGSVQLSPRMLQAMYNLSQSHSFRVTSIAGGSHSPGSSHYDGVSFDVDRVNGSAVSAGANARNFMQACRDQGATVVLGPGDAGHGSHIHCQW